MVSYREEPTEQTIANEPITELSNTNEPTTVRTERTDAATEVPAESIIDKRQSTNISRPSNSATNKAEIHQEPIKKELKRGLYLSGTILIKPLFYFFKKFNKR